MTTSQPGHLDAWPGHSRPGVSRRERDSLSRECRQPTGSMAFEKQSGVFLHVSSLPGPDGIGTLGAPAETFVDFLATAEQSLWQTCPIGPTDPDVGNSPYSAYSARAGNPLFIDLDALVDRGWLADLDRPGFDEREVEYDRVDAFKQEALRDAFAGFEADAEPAAKTDFETYCGEAGDWLEEYALFRALNDRFDGEWVEWPAEAKHRDPDALDRYREELAEEIRFRKFLQWVFETQWQALRSYADDRGVSLVGDMPIYVGTNSADVWANPELFKLDEDLEPAYVAGVPPDEFSETGQLWGMPVYDWAAHAEDEYEWWLQRFEGLLDRFDVFRIDHFKGFESFYQIPADHDTAVDGEWVTGPGEALFQTVEAELGELPIIVEDLGHITEETRALRDAFEFPGMSVAAMADWCDPSQGHHPASYTENTVAYASTHDTDTVPGWYASLSDAQRECLHDVVDGNSDDPHWNIVETIWASEAVLTLVQCQDLLGLGTAHRFNFPGTAEGNWEWRVLPSELTDDVAERLAAVSRRTDRA
ncbi:4-alpha-glucanotransferase [Halorhabdus sp. CUG00001]|uniref:4-alpha-glucanotransferase n=1 Tax=Halorhabdus sp. CUG00001 TaxID=2600297 RepID=UPI002104AE5E|nr:4-alpha-glucanotransferase [Halorhabdus sp. CUG00001]